MNKVDLVAGGPDQPEQPDVFDLECAECDAETHGEAHSLADEGWNWVSAVAQGKQLGFALCPEHSQDKDLLETHMNAYQDRIYKAEEGYKQKQTDGAQQDLTAV